MGPTSISKVGQKKGKMSSRCNASKLGVDSMSGEMIAYACVQVRYDSRIVDLTANT